MALGVFSGQYSGCGAVQHYERFTPAGLQQGLPLLVDCSTRSVQREALLTWIISSGLSSVNWFLILTDCCIHTSEQIYSIHYPS